ncbi:MAG: metallophosphoesterase [Deltaproteobacteria bacterium]|nr:metallophosphoesterase [Deltaproteobacteria bacterium]
MADLHLGSDDPDDERAFLRAMFAACARAKVDHVVVAGDLTEYGGASSIHRFEAAADDAGFGPDRRTVVKGNHDLRARRLETEVFSAPASTRMLGPVRLTALDSTRRGGPTSALYAHAMGRVGPSQLERLRDVLSTKHGRHGEVIALHHHVNKTGAGTVVELVGRLLRMWGELEDRDALLDACVQGDVTVALTGHDHTPHVFRVKRRGHEIRCFIAGATRDLERFRVLDFADGALQGWKWQRL